MTACARPPIDWLIFLALGFMWGSSYLFIKLAVDDFGTFTLVALRLLVGALLLWSVVRVAGQALPRDRRIYGHLLVMAVINITIPFLLITWAEQSVDSRRWRRSSPRPCRCSRSSSRRCSCPTNRSGSTASSASSSGSSGVVIIVPPRPDRRGRQPAAGELALLGVVVQLRRRHRLLATQRARPPADDPGRLPGHVRADHLGRPRAPLRAAVGPPRPTPRRSSRSCGSGILGSGLAYLAVFRLFAPLGRDAHDARRLPAAGRRHRPRLPRPRRNRSTPRLIVGTALVIAGVGAGQQPVRPAPAVRSGAAGRGDLAPYAPRPRRSAADREQQRPADDQHRRRRSGAPPRRGRSPRPAGPSPRPPRRPSPTRAAARRRTAAPRSARRGCSRYATSVSQPPTAARRAAAAPP